MKLIKFMASMLFTALALTALAGAQTTTTDSGQTATTPTVGQRQKNQQKRIGQGIQNGSLTAAEAARLERREAALQKEKREFKSDGNLSDEEKARLDKQQDRLSKQIYNQKHDAQNQPPARGEVEKRDRAQQQRIGQGVASGSLTPGEAAKLEGKEARLQREERELRRENGGRLSPEDKARVNRQQNRLSRDIHREKHDGQHSRRRH